MNIKPLKQPAFPSRGITILEILLVVSLLIILVSFAMPSIGGAAAKAEMTATFENVQYSIEAARHIARMNESGVSVNFETLAGETAQNISFTSQGEGEGERIIELQDYRVPADILLISDLESFVFDERGLVEKPGKIMLVSKTDDSVTSVFEVN